MQSTGVLERLFSLRGRVALITGASGGIGGALARGMAGAGAAVALHGRSPERLRALEGELRAVGADVAAFEADLADLAACAALVASVLARFGRLDVLVNNAGLNRRKPVLEVTALDYAAVMDVNLRAAYFLSQHAGRAMIARGEGGKIVNVGSLTSSIGLSSGSIYGASKGGLVQLTRALAVEWAEHNIQVNALCPGFIQTPLTAEHVLGNPHRREWLMARIPSRRAGTPEDLVGAGLLLASAASDYMTGQTLYVDGGFLAGSPW